MSEVMLWYKISKKLKAGEAAGFWLCMFYVFVFQVTYLRAPLILNVLRAEPLSIYLIMGT